MREMDCGIGVRPFLVALAWLAIALVPAGVAHAQYVCSGNGAGEHIVGMTQGGNGIASMPLCVADEQQAQQYNQPPPQPIQLPSAHAAFAMDWATTDLYWTTFADSFDEAYASALGACRKAGGKDCKTLDGFSNQCSAVALDGEGYVHQAMDVLAEGAERGAMQRCNAANRAGICRLKTTAVCSAYSAIDGTGNLSQSINGTARDAPEDLIERESAKWDDREYWGAIVESGSDVFSIVNQRSREQALGKVSAKCSHGQCNQVAVWKNACAARANGVLANGDPLNASYGGIDADPQRAYANAVQACVDKTGRKCVGGAVECSGRAYIGYEWKGPATQAPAPRARATTPGVVPAREE